MSSTDNADEQHLEPDRYKRVPGRELGVGAHGEVYLATIEAPPPPHPSTVGYTAESSLPMRGIVSEPSTRVKRPADSEIAPEPPTEGPSLSLSKADRALLAKYDSLKDPGLYSTWDNYPAMQQFPATQTEVAVKRMRLTDHKAGLSREALREVRLLREVNHPYIIDVHDVYIRGQNLYVVMETLPYDLEKLIRDTTIIMRDGDVKRYMHMLLQAMAHLHDRGIVHRDLKPANLLIAPDGKLKLSDFGGAREVGSPSRRMSPEACTIWYRAPELLFGSTCYGAASDMWSVGCVFGELLRRNALFQGQSEVSQLCKIAALMGAPDEESWPGVSSLNSYFTFTPGAMAVPMQELFPAAEPAGRDLVSKLLQWCPSKRLTAKEALQHPFFTTGKPMTDIDKLPKRKI